MRFANQHATVWIELPDYVSQTAFGERGAPKRPFPPKRLSTHRARGGTWRRSPVWRRAGRVRAAAKRGGNIERVDRYGGYWVST